MSVICAFGKSSLANVANRPAPHATSSIVVSHCFESLFVRESVSAFALHPGDPKQEFLLQFHSD